MPPTAPFSDLRLERRIAAMSLMPILAPVGRWWLIRRFQSIKRLGDQRRLIGLIGEAVAAQHLQRQHYRILATNLADRIGEIDILALAPTDDLVVVEVKSSLARAKPNADPHYPEQRVDPAKAQRLLTMAGQLARRRRWRDRTIRLDIVAVDLDSQSLKAIDLRHHVGAIQAAG